MEFIFRLFDFNVYNKPLPVDYRDDDNAGSDDDMEDNKPVINKYVDQNKFFIQMFGLDETGKTCSIIVEDFKPFFYVKVADHWTIANKNAFLKHIQVKMGKFYENSIVECKLIKRKKLYGFDGGKEYKFIKFGFNNVYAFNKAKNLWYSPYASASNKIKTEDQHKLLQNGYVFLESETYLYEANIPPLLRFFHIKNISPSGWVALPKKKTFVVTPKMKSTTCDYEFMIHYNDIIALNHKETMVPYKICSFDIEASSSHGDFPIPIKTYKKLSINIIEYFEKYKKNDAGNDANTTTLNNEMLHQILKNIILLAFGYEEEDIEMDSETDEEIYDFNNIERVYPIMPPKSKSLLMELINKWLSIPVRNIFSDNNEVIAEQMNIENMFEKVHKEMNSKDDDEDEGTDANTNSNESGEVSNSGFITVNEVTNVKKKTKLQIQNYNQTHTIVDIISEFLNMGFGSGNGDSEDSDDPSISVKVKGTTKPKVKTGANKTTKSKNRDMLMQELTISLNTIFPKLEGDKITFIGSTFLKYGEKEPYMNHCAVLNTCDQIPAQNIKVESYKTEKEVLLAWKDLIQKENPDIIIGYNIFGFDYEFMFRRAEENHCVEEFLQLSRNKNEICGDKIKYRDQNNGWHELDKYKIEESSLQIASGQHDLKYIKMNGRLQIDLYNYFRREENLSSYKLDYVAGHFIGDYVKKVANSDESSESVVIHSGNLTGLQEGSFIHFEEIGHSTEYYDSGSKFKVASVDKENHLFCISIPETYHKNICTSLDFTKKIRWCLAKDDVTPKDIFKMTNGSDADRAVIAKYCIQDCNLVHYLMNKVDILTGFSEMSKICSVPIHFLVSRGQGIKLTSYIAKKCREKNTLIPVIEKGNSDEGYEGAIVLDPKCDLYLDNPVACVDYASLYPSSMISENLSHDSKVWTKEYDLDGNLIAETGDKGIRVGENGQEEEYFIYDNLPNYNYVDVKYDTYKYVRKTAKSAAEKIKSGYKCCRFAQSINRNERAIMPSILEELLASRKATRKLIPNEKDEFMKNVLDKRQLGYKLTANSLYGQCGAKTSTFYEKDVAASTTATGRLLLTYAKRVIEECYGDAICNTMEYGPVLTKAEYIYGDSVANYTPVYVSYLNNNKERIIDICTIEQLAEKYGGCNWVKCTEPGKQEKEFCELEGIETWTENGWTKLHRVIRHNLAPHKKMIRILTHTGLVDVTDDHSLILKNGEEISPNNCAVGTELLHYENPKNEIQYNAISGDEAQIMGFFFGDGSCGNYDCPSGKKSSWALNNSSMEIINKYLELCKNVYSDFNWVVMPTLKSSGVYKIAPRSSKYGHISEFVTKYRSLLYYGKSKIIPNEILNANYNIKLAFFNGLYDADGDKDKNGYIRIDQKNQISAANICLLAQSIGFLTSINSRKDKNNIYRITMTKNKQRKNICAIKKMHEIEYTGYVYDLTTENHHFAAGIGNMIVHNTDSVFFTFNLQTPDGEPIRGKKALDITIELAQEAGHLASSFLKGPHDLEYEKTFMPFCLLSKKRYVGMLYETDSTKCKRKEMGIVLKRRDNAPIVKDVYGGIIDILMKEKDIQKSIAFLKSCLRDIVEEKYPIEKLIITKSLRSGYKNPQQIAHKVLADRIMERDPGNKIGSGDRIPFVYIKHPSLEQAVELEPEPEPILEIQNNPPESEPEQEQQVKKGRGQKKATVKPKPAPKPKKVKVPKLKLLQGDKIETPKYIAEKNLKIDYGFYITNQIMKPVQQVFALVLEKIWKMQNKELKIHKFKQEIQDMLALYDNDTSNEKYQTKLEQMKNKEVKTLLFDEFLQ
jgi:DNA polymerase elongation subunit (family B)